MGSVAKRSLDVQALQRAQADAKVCTLRAQGWEFRDIAEHLGLGSPAAAQQAMRRALVETMRAPADELRGVELTLINQGIRMCWEIINNPQPLLDRAGNAVAVYDGVSGEERGVPDQGVMVQALAQLNKFGESRRKLMGLDAPTRSISATVKPTLADAQQMAIDAGVPAEVVYGTVTELPAGD
jgi:hypothetical protein